ncbi:MAG: SNF2 helicase associated domain-containing protein [Saprospiraceae bacterium]|nr:SNF2 helicase associated domain-containing protein [Saprospiraceae bacterium]
MTVVVFNLAAFNDSLYLPTALLVEIDSRGRLGYMQQRATAATIVPYGIELTPALARLLDRVELLVPKALEIRFKPPKAKSPTPLASLLSDPATKPAVEKFVFERVDGFLKEVIKEGFPLTLELERKTPACDLQIRIQEQELIPHISFSKTDSGVEYRFRLGSEEASWPIQSRDVRPLTNTDPAWLLVDYELYRVPGINGNMVKPFRNKDVIQVPPDKAKVYFRQFVAKNAGRTRIEASGFEMHTTRTLLATRLRPTENVLERAWYLQAVFEYQGAQFTNGEKRDRVTSVRFANDDEIVVEQIARDMEMEQQRLRYLLETGLEPDGKLFKCNAQTDLESLIEWLTGRKQGLEHAGFVLELPQVEGKSIALATGRLDIKTSASDDWFDVRGRVHAGNFSFPFKALWQHLRKRDRYYLLPDGSWFLIPESWFARYSEMAEAAKEGPDDSLRLPKALFTLLQSAELDSGVGEYAAINPDAVAYETSPDLKATLRPYQLSGVKWLIGHYQAGFGACLADDMGLGKTLQTIAYLLYAKSQRNGQTDAETGGAQLNLFQAHQAEIRPLCALVILPASLVFNWQNELARFAPTLFVNAHTGPKRLQDARALASHDVVLTTYHTARQDLELLRKVSWHVMVLDESQQIKNRASEVSKVVLSLKADNKVSLSGTPIENSLSDLWSQMEFINPATLGSFSEFRDQFLLPIEKRNEEAAKERLFKRVRPFFLRRTKEEVAPDLPELTEQLFYSEMTEPQYKLYERTKSAARNEILALFDDPKTRFQALQALTRLRQLANDPRLVEQDYKGGSGKFDDVLAQWDTVHRSGHKVLFFSSFERHLQLFKSEFERAGYSYAWLTGDTPTHERAREVARFQEDTGVQAFFMTVKAGGVGLNLTAADYVFLLDPWWNPAVEDQAIARAHRIGQKRPVTALRFLSRNTIEDKIRQLQERKKRLGQALFAAEETPALTREEMEVLLG